MGDGASWTSDMIVSGAFAAGARLTLHAPCAAAMVHPTSVHLSVVSPDGLSAQSIGNVTFRRACASGSVSVDIPVTVPLPFRLEGLLRLTLGGPSPIDFELAIGGGTFLEATNFLGTP